MFARTARLMLRPGWPEDATVLRDAIAHESVARNLAQLPWPYTLGDAQWFLTQPHASCQPRFLVFDDPGGTPRLVGGIELMLAGDTPELGYWLTPAAWGRGYATEAGAAVVAIARDALRLPRLRARPFIDNPASARVLHKLGFRSVGHGQHASLARGGEVACDEMALDLAAAAPPSLALAA